MKNLFPQKIKLLKEVMFARKGVVMESRLSAGSVSSLLEHEGRYFVQMAVGSDKYFVEITKQIFDIIGAASVKINGTVPVHPSHLPRATEESTAAFIAELAKSSPKPTDEELWKKAIDAAKRLSAKKGQEYPSRWANSWAVRWYKKRGGKFTGKKPTKAEVKKDHDFVKGDIHQARKSK